MKKSKFIMQFSSDGKRYFYLTAANGEVILTSETYNSKQAALKGIISVIDNAPIESRFDAMISKDKKPYFILTAANGEVIGTSEMYETQQGVLTGIAAVQTAAAKAEIIDRT